MKAMCVAVGALPAPELASARSVKRSPAVKLTGPAIVQVVAVAAKVHVAPATAARFLMTV